MTKPTIDRRRLLTLGGWGMVSLSLSGLAGCGGGDGDPPAPGGGGGGGRPVGFEGEGIAAAGVTGAPVSVAERGAALDRVVAAVQGMASVNGRFDAVALVQQLAASSAFQRVGLSANMDNAWAVFTDGRRLLIPNNHQPLPAPAPVLKAALRVAALGRERRAAQEGDPYPALLVGGQLRHLDMMGDIPLMDVRHVTQNWVDADTLPGLRRIAAGRGFDVVNLSPNALRTDGPETGIDGLMQVRGDGVLFVNGFGAEVTAADFGCSAISTTTPASEANEARYAAALDASELVYMTPLVGQDRQWVCQKLLAITPDFARAHGWSFPLNSIGIFNVTGGGLTRHWQSLLGAAGMDTLMTWDRPVSIQRMLAYVEDFFHLSLGTNRLGGDPHGLSDTPRLRAYGIEETVEFLSLKGLADDQSGKDQIAYFPSSAATRYVNTLIPSIDLALIDDVHGKFSLGGLFGESNGGRVMHGQALSRFDEPLLAKAADPQVTGMNTLMIDSWEGNHIEGSLDGFDAGFLQVLNGRRCSNAVQVTRWTIPLLVTRTLAGGLRLTVTMEMQFRADVRPWRLQLRDVPGERAVVQMPLYNRRNPMGRHVATGEISQLADGITTTVSWTGTGQFGDGPPPSMLSLSGVLDWVNRSFSGTLLAFGGSHEEREVRRRDEEVLSDSTAMVSYGAEASITLLFDNAWNLIAGSYPLPTETRQLLGSRVQETMLSWPAVIAEFPPSLTEGGN